MELLDFFASLHFFLKPVEHFEIFALRKDIINRLWQILSLQPQYGNMNYQQYQQQMPENQLPPEKEPYLPPLEPKLIDTTYTLVLDLDETLIHYYEENGKEKYRVRPKAYDFIRAMAEHYELVIFTAGLQDVPSPI